MPSQCICCSYERYLVGVLVEEESNTFRVLLSARRSQIPRLLHTTLSSVRMTYCVNPLFNPLPHTLHLSHHCHCHDHRGMLYTTTPSQRIYTCTHEGERSSTHPYTHVTFYTCTHLYPYLYFASLEYTYALTLFTVYKSVHTHTHIYI